MDGLGDRHRHAKRLGRGRTQAQVLGQETGREAGGVAAGRTPRGNLSSLAVLRPVLALITSMTAGARPPLTPSATASAVAAIAVAERKLLASFISWPRPAPPDVEHAPEHLEQRPHALELRRQAGDHDRERALHRAAHAARDRRVQVAMPRPASAAATSAATACPVVEKIDVDPERAAVDQAVRPERDRAHHLRRRQADEHDLGAVRDLGRRAAASTPSPASASIASARRSCTTSRCPAASSRLLIGPPIWPSPTKPIGAVISCSTREHGRFTAASPR